METSRCVNYLTERHRAGGHDVSTLNIDPDQPFQETVMYTTSQFSSIRKAAAEAFTQLLFAATVAIVVGGTAALCVGRSVLFA
jgi:hypothetical protein